MGMARGAFELVSNAVIKGLNLNRAGRLVCNFTEKISPVCTIERDGQTYRFSCPNALTHYRAETLFTKEPETIEWIDTFAPGDVLVDIGANVGMYSIYAGARGHQVIAFEPESQNYALIHRNIFLNGLSDRVQCLNIAMSDTDGLDFLFMRQFLQGAAFNNLGEALDPHHREFKPAFKQAVVSSSLDSFLQRFPDRFPNHIKVDVDGLESQIIRGAARTLRDERVKSMLVEINEDLAEDREACRAIEAAGLTLRHKKQSPGVAKGEFKHAYNYIFARSGPRA
jgi:FkbM family methyltransferase